MLSNLIAISDGGEWKLEVWEHSSATVAVFQACAEGGREQISFAA